MIIGSDTLWNSLPAPVVLLDDDDGVVDVNSAAEFFLNLSAQKLRGSLIFDRLSIDTPIGGALERARTDSAVVFVNDVVITKYQSALVTCNIQIAPVLGDDNGILLLIEPKRMDEKIGQARQRNKSAQSAIGMAEMLAHEIKNPLAGITGAAQLLALNLDHGEQELTELIVMECRRIVALLDQVDQFGQQSPPVLRQENIHDILDRARQSAAIGVAENMEILVDYDPSLPLTYVDANQMIQVFLNLINNAAEAAGKTGGSLTIRTFYDSGLRRRDNDGSQNSLPLQVEIIDDGPGIPAEIYTDIFEPFVSGRENGTGLGLALANQTIADHGGWISVTSFPGCTTFRVSLPIAPNEQQGAK